MNFSSLHSVITKPLAHREKRSLVYGNVLLVWLLSVIVALPLILSLALSMFEYHLISEAILIIISMFIPGMLILIVYNIAGIAVKASTVKHENVRAMELRKSKILTFLKCLPLLALLFSSSQFLSCGGGSMYSISRLSNLSSRRATFRFRS